MFDRTTDVNFGADRSSVNDSVYDDSNADNTVVPIVCSKMVDLAQDFENSERERRHIEQLRKSNRTCGF